MSVEKNDGVVLLEHLADAAKRTRDAGKEESISKEDWGPSPIDIEGNKPWCISGSNPAVERNSNWIIAIDAWDYCDASLLEEMLRRHPVPFELQPVIADIISGKRKQNKKGAARLKIPAGHRLAMAAIYARLKKDLFDPVLKGVDSNEIADQLGVEPLEVRRDLQATGREFKSHTARSAGVSEETIKGLCEDLREKVKNYPHI